jgi:hypothetical protein
VEGAYITEGCLADGKPDVNKIKPIIFNLESAEYIAFGKVVAKAVVIGQELKVKKV